MFKVKICGVRLKKDVSAAAHAGADAIGLNFFDGSIRFVDPEQADTRQLSAHAGEMGLHRVGVFVNPTVDETLKINEQVGLSAIQLHGDETLALTRELIAAGMTVIRAIRLPAENLTCELIEQRVEPWINLGCHLLLDSQSGGSGKCLDWEVVGKWADTQDQIPWTLAGGLNAENVAEAIKRSRAASVDTASGAEEPRGIKSAAKIQAFVAASKNAFDAF